MSLKVLVSMTWAMLVDSDVATAWAPSGLKAMPSGSMPTGISASTLPEAISATETMASSSLAMNMRLPLGSTSRYSGIGEGRNAAHDLELGRVDDVDRVVIAGADEHFLEIRA